VEAVHVLRRVDGLDNRGLVHVLRERELDEEAVHVFAAIELRDHFEQARGGRVGQQRVVLGGEPQLLAGANLVAHVDGRGRVVADQHRHEPWTNIVLAHQPRDLFGRLALEFRGHARAVELARLRVRVRLCCSFHLRLPDILAQLSGRA
jgi:hypothetical protein